MFALRPVKYAIVVAALTVSIYDAILLFPYELLLVWNGKFTLVRASYVASRYSICVFMLLPAIGEYSLFIPLA